MSTQERIPLGSLPASLIDEAMQSIRRYLIGFCRLADSEQPVPALLGSGTLVRVRNCSAILTAEHVLRILPPTGRLGILLEPNQGNLSIDRSGVTPIPIARGTVNRDGPDLGALVLSKPIAGSIAAKKSFFSLDSNRDRLLNDPPARDMGFWFANGFPATEAQRARDEEGEVMRFLNMSGAGGPDEPYVVGEHDYYRFPVADSNRDDAPESFGGMSGGGLWQIPIRRLDSGKLVPLEPLLSGVIYYQVRTDSEVALLCHGRNSVYRVAYRAILAASGC